MELALTSLSCRACIPRVRVLPNSLAVPAENETEYVAPEWTYRATGTEGDMPYGPRYVIRVIWRIDWLWVSPGLFQHKLG